MTEHSQLIEEWASTLEAEDVNKFDDFIFSALSNEEKEVDGYKKIFHAHKLFSCIISFMKGEITKGAKGHYELTCEVLKPFKFLSSANILKSFARASCLPDLFHFEDLEYHAQSSTHTNGDLINPGGKKDKEDFVIFLSEQLKFLDSAISNKDVEQIIFYTGTLFHAVQDLACHQGMSNPEHAYWNKIKQSPDMDAMRYPFALLVNKKFAEEHVYDRLLKAEQELNSAPPMFGLSKEHLVKLPEIKKQAKSFELSVLSKIKSSNTARWFSWHHSNDNETALNEINKEIFEKIR